MYLNDILHVFIRNEIVVYLIPQFFAESSITES